MDRRKFLKYSGIIMANLIFTKSLLAQKKHDNFVWMNIDKNWSEKDWEYAFNILSKANIKNINLSVNINVFKNSIQKNRFDIEDFIIPLAKKHNIKIYGWFITFLKNEKELLTNHKNWFQINKLGQSCIDHPPYVGYYRWLCPSNKDAREYLLTIINDLSKIKGLAGVHLDYIRYPDVILPIKLQEKYGIVQSKIYPQYDFCYCDTCKEKFEKETKLKFDPEKYEKEWEIFRLNNINSFVNTAYDIVHKNNKLLSAAVFPTPEMARKNVRQQWDKWNIDLLFPMIYHNFYGENINWIKKVTNHNLTKIKNTTKLYPGIFLPAIDNKNLKKVINLCYSTKAHGIALFSYNEEKIKILSEI